MWMISCTSPHLITIEYQIIPENVCDLQRFRFSAINNIHFSEIFSVNIDGIVLPQVVLHPLKITPPTSRRLKLDTDHARQNITAESALQISPHIKCVANRRLKCSQQFIYDFRSQTVGTGSRCSEMFTVNTV